MVLEHLFPEQLLERKEWSAFLLAFIYSTVSIVIARVLFPANSGLVAVVFTSIFLIPYFSTLLRREEQQEEQDAGLSFTGLLRDNADIIKIYFFVFFGIYLAFMLYSFLAPFLGYDVGSVFREQLSLEGVRGGAAFSTGLFWDIVINNWWVLLATFVVALVAGDGAVFFVAWNASAWGTIFGYRAVAAGSVEGSALVALFTVLAITLPHVFLEGGAYILAAISGGVLSDEVVKRSDEIVSFVVYFLGAAVFYTVLYVLLKALLPSVLAGVFAILIALGALYCMHFIFSSVRDSLVFRYNFFLFALAIAVFLVGAAVETLVLFNSEALNTVYTKAMLAGF